MFLTIAWKVLLLSLLTIAHSLKESTKSGDKVTRAHKHMADSMIGVATYLALLPIGKEDPLCAFYKKTSDSLEKIRVRGRLYNIYTCIYM